MKKKMKKKNEKVKMKTERRRGLRAYFRGTPSTTVQAGRALVWNTVGNHVCALGSSSHLSIGGFCNFLLRIVVYFR